MHSSLGQWLQKNFEELLETTGYKNVFWCSPVIFFKPNGSHLPEEDPTLPQTSGGKIEVFCVGSTGYWF